MFQTGCVDAIRNLLKEHYKSVATLTSDEDMDKIEHFVDNAALHVFNHTANRFQRLRSPSMLSTTAMMTLPNETTPLTIGLSIDCLTPRVNDPVMVWEDFNSFVTDVNELTPSTAANLPENAVNNETRKPP